MSMNCPFCRAGIPDDSWFCDQCGKELHFCPECRKPKKGTQCAACGADLVDAEEFFNVSSSKMTLALNADGVRIELREGIFGRTQGVYPEFENDRYVSGRHGEFRCDDGVWKVRDFGSTNGTFVGGRKLNAGEWAELAAGDEVKIATTVYKLG